MSYLLEILGRGLLAELAAAFRDLLADDHQTTTTALRANAHDHPGSAAAHRDLAVRLLHEQQYDDACRTFHNALAIDADDRVSRIGLACCLDSLSQTAEAAARLESMVGAGATDAALVFALGFCHEKLGATDHAVAAYEQAVELSPDLRNGHERLAAIYLSRDEPEAALAHYEHLCWCDPGELSLHLTLATLYARVGRHDDAVRQFEHAASLDPDRWESLDEFYTQYDEARLDQAIGLVESMIAEQPDGAGQYLRLGNLLNQAGRTASALAAYEDAITLNPNCLEAAVKIGSIHLGTGDYDAAAKAFSSAIEINDRLVDAYIGLGVAHQESGATCQAIASFDAAALIEPNSELLFSEMAKLQLRVSAAKQRHHHLTPHTHDAEHGASGHGMADPLVTEQIANLRDAISKHPVHADLHYRLGVLLRHVGDADGAIRAFGDAVAINPHYTKALVKLGLTLREIGDTRAGIRAFQRALELDQESIDLHYQLGLMFADEGDFAAALDRFEYATQHDPHNEDYVANLALALQNMGLLDRASATWQTLCDITCDGPPAPSEDTKRVRSRFT